MSILPLESALCNPFDQFWEDQITILDVQKRVSEPTRFVCRRFVSQCFCKHHMSEEWRIRFGQSRGSVMLLQQRPQPNLLMALEMWWPFSDVPNRDELLSLLNPCLSVTESKRMWDPGQLNCLWLRAVLDRESWKSLPLPTSEGRWRVNA